VLRAPEQRAAVAEAARRALAVIEPVYGMSRPADDDQSRYARNNRATYELHDRAGERTSVLFCTYRYETASEILLGGSIYPAMQSFLLAARAQGLGTCITSWASYGGEEVLREAIGIPPEWLLAGHVVLGWPRGRHGPVRRRPLGDVVDLDRWDQPAVALAGERTPGTDFDVLRFRGKLPD
jgi:nitroreductase